MNFSALVTYYQVTSQEGFTNLCSQDFPGDAVVKNPPTGEGDTGSSPGLGRSHMPWSN